jgi:hypothetical protein
MKRLFAMMLALILFFNLGTLAGFDAGRVFAAEEAETQLEEEDEGYPIYFLNSNHWNRIGSYIYGDKGELLGGWGSTFADEADELGGDWVRVTPAEKPPYSIIFYNADNDSERAELYVADEKSIYITVTGAACNSVAEAENVLDDTTTTVYFFNRNAEGTLYEEVYGYAYANGASVKENWPGQKAKEEPALGDDWYSVEIARNASVAPFTIIFNDGNGSQLADVNIESYKDNYVTGAGALFGNQTAAEASVGIVTESVIYFLNSKDWPAVNSYVYGNPGEALGSWPGRETEAADELGDKWLKVTVPAKPAFNIIFFNTEKPDERAELQIPSDRQIYVTGSNAVYGSAEEAELSEGLGDPSNMTTLFFYDYNDWGDMAGYFYGKDEGDASYTIGKGWPGTAAEVYETSEKGHIWWTTSVPKNAETAPFYGVFNNGVDQTKDVFFDDKVNVYVTPAGQKFATKEEAELAAEKETATGPECEEGPNTDLENYDVNYDGYGAAASYVTYEAESASTNATVLEKDTVYRSSIQTEASGREAVELKDTGDYVEFSLEEAANSLVLRYSVPDSEDGEGIDTTLHLYVNGEEKEILDLTSRHAWVYGSYPFTNNVSQGKAHRFFDDARFKLDETIPAGARLKLEKTGSDDAEFYVIDFIETELVGDKKAQPEDSVSVEDFGAIADDGEDDYEAFVKAITEAGKQKKSVWIPEGEFTLTEKRAIDAENVRIYGAGMWYTTLKGAGAAFKYGGTSKFYDFAMTGVSTVRDDKGDLAAFENNGKKATNVTVQNIWIEHTKVGIWSANTDRLAVQGSRIRNTYADGINLCSKTNEAVVRNNSLRNTGDDAIAIWPWLADCTDNLLTHNTIQVPTLANGIAIYGGAGNKAIGNHVMDTINNGSGIVVGTEFETKKEFSGTTTVSGNLLERCGSKQTDENYDIGAIWLWSSSQPMNAEFVISNNVMKDSLYEGILLECNSDLTGVNIINNTVDGATNAIEVFKPAGSYGHGHGSATVEGLKAENLTGELIVNGNDNFVITDNGGNQGASTGNENGDEQGNGEGTQSGDEGGNTQPGDEGGNTLPDDEGGNTQPGDEGGNTQPGDEGGNTQPDDGDITQPDDGGGSGNGGGNTKPGHVYVPPIVTHVAVVVVKVVTVAVKSILNTIKNIFRWF